MNKLVRANQICEMTGLSRGTLYELIKKDRFPRGIKISTRTVAWELNWVEDYIEKCKKNREE